MSEPTQPIKKAPQDQSQVRGAVPKSIAQPVDGGELEEILGLLAQPGLDPEDETTQQLAQNIARWHQAAIQQAIVEVLEKIQDEIIAQGGDGSPYHIIQAEKEAHQPNPEGDTQP